MKNLNKRRKRQKKFLKYCKATGGICINPMCALGCIEKW